MAAYTSKTEQYLQRVDPDRAHWTKLYGAGDTVPYSGIYKCLGCNKEITSNQGDPFPPQNRHQHTVSQGKIVWRLIVRTDTEGNRFGLN